MEDCVIVHHGIKGMKWGVRRYRNKDGTLTAEGKKRYNVDNYKTLAKGPSVVPTKSGDGIRLQSRPSNRLMNFLAAHNRKIRATAENTRNYNIVVSGKTIGDMQLFKESKDSLNVVWVGVDNSARGKGYATAAMIGAIEVAKRSGCKQVTLEVPGNSPDARHIYEKLGFVEQKQLSTPEEDMAWGGLTSMKLDLVDAEKIIRHSCQLKPR